MDFITGFPPAEGTDATNCLVITDRLTKSVILVGMRSITADTLADAFLVHFYMHHGLPTAIVSDRGTQFVSEFWSIVCERLRIQRRLSTAFHPQSDGSTERTNQEVERILRVFSCFSQEDWMKLLPVAAIAINNREAASTGLSPFFFTHGYHVDPIDSESEITDRKLSGPGKAGNSLVNRLRCATEWAQTSMAFAQDQQEKQANRTRQAAPIYKKGDKVWLNLRNVKSIRPYKKLDWLHAQYTVVEAPTSHTVRLNVPTGIHPVFHVELIRPASTNPLPSQFVDDSQPPPLVVDGELEYQIAEILAARTKRVGRGSRREVLVRWTGYTECTWEPLSAVGECTALDVFEKRHGNVSATNSPLPTPEAARSTGTG